MWGFCFLFGWDKLTHHLLATFFADCSLYKYRVASKWVSDCGQNRVMHAFDNIAKRCLFPDFTCNAVIKEDCPDLI